MKLGCSDGIELGSNECAVDGIEEGSKEVFLDGCTLGLLLGSKESVLYGVVLGSSLGSKAGLPLGIVLVITLGLELGFEEGIVDGTKVNPVAHSRNNDGAPCSSVHNRAALVALQHMRCLEMVYLFSRQEI
eukprot:6519015-Ditylum_brightwellii.AAC.1